MSQGHYCYAARRNLTVGGPVLVRAVKIRDFVVSAVAVDRNGAWGGVGGSGREGSEDDGLLALSSET